MSAFEHALTHIVIGLLLGFVLVQVIIKLGERR